MNIIYIVSHPNEFLKMVFLFYLHVGANGGRGGDVILECSPRLWDFSSLKHHIVVYSSCFSFNYFFLLYLLLLLIYTICHNPNI